MIKLYESGVYLVNGTEIVPDNAECVAQWKNRTGQELTKDAAKGTMAYRILESHNTPGSMD